MIPLGDPPREAAKSIVAIDNMPRLGRHAAPVDGCENSAKVAGKAGDSARR